MARRIPALLAALAFFTQPLAAQTAIPTPQSSPPKLLVVISVDQFSSDVFSEYRRHYTAGLKKLQDGVVFPSGYQSHNMTETCPGHSTILTGSRPARTGIIGNEWIDQTVARQDKKVYCAEDERVPGTNSGNTYVVSPLHLLVPTLGERMKTANPRARVVSVAGKDRSAIMMGGHAPDSIWWWTGKGSFSSHAGVTDPAAQRVNDAVAKQLARPAAAMKIPAYCASKNWALDLGNGRTVGTGRFERKAGDIMAFRAAPELDAATLTLATALIEEKQLGRQAQTDIIDIGLAANDYIGHAFGTEGLEMCIQQHALDQALGQFFDRLDRARIDYMVVLTADHGGHDIPERQILSAMPDETRVDRILSPALLSQEIAKETGIDGRVLFGVQPFGDYWLSIALTPEQREKVLAAAVARMKAHPQVAAVFTKAELAAAPYPSGPPEAWSLLQRARGSFHPTRSGDFVVILKPLITGVSTTRDITIATHGSAWDNDRRVPILFWRKGLIPFEQPAGVETIDIMPTLARTIGLVVPKEEIDGRCLDLYAGPADSCK